MKTTLYSSSGTTFSIEYSRKGDAYEAVINGRPTQVQLLSTRNGALTLLVNGQPMCVHLAKDGSRTLVAIAGRVYAFTQGQEQQVRSGQREKGKLNPEVRSPMPGKILEVRVAEGMTVEAGEALVLLEAMKMENTLTADGTAKVKRIHVAQGELVDLGQILVELEFVEQGEAKHS